MGFGNLATTIIMFIAVMLLSTAVIVSFRTQTDQAQASMRSQSEFLNNQIKTNIDIVSTNYSASNLRIYVLNNGKTTLKPETVDVYVNNIFIPRDDANRTISIEASTDTRNPGLWDPDEIIRIDVDTTLSSGTQAVRVGTTYGISDESTFSV